MPESVPAPVAGKPRLLVLASTYPRWADDPEPGFVHALNRALKERFEVLALVPAASGVPHAERLDGVEIRRYRYAPGRWQSLVNGGGILANLKRSPWKWALLPGFVLGQCWAARYWTAKFRPQLIQAHWLLPQGLAARSSGGVPYVVTSHGADVFGLRGRLMAGLKRAIARRAASIAVVSEAMRAPVATLVGPRVPVTVLPMGVDLQRRFCPDPALPRDPNELLFVGRLVEKKGLAVLLLAMAELLGERPRLHLSVIGDGPECESCRALALRLGIAERVNFLGNRSQGELPAFYRRAAVFVAPFVVAASGDQEGLGLVLVEAAGCGCPIVASGLSVCRDVLALTEGALEVAPGDAVVLGEALTQALAAQVALREQALAARPALLARFDWTSVAERYADWLTTVLERS